MNTLDFRSIARQLRKPEGENGKRIAIQMNDGNLIINKLTIDALELKPNDELLEIGMGNGAFVKDIIAMGNSVKYFGCDFSQTMVDEAQIINAELVKTGQAHFSLSSMDNLPFPDEKFDSIFTVNTIYFWDDPEKELREISRVLKRDGILLIALRPKSVMKDMPFVEYGFNLFEKDDVESLLVNSGFVVTRTIEETEPEQVLGEITIKLATLIVIAQKNTVK